MSVCELVSPQVLRVYAHSEGGTLQGIDVHVVYVSSDQPLLLPARCDNEAASGQMEARSGWGVRVPLQEGSS